MNAEEMCIEFEREIVRLRERLDLLEGTDCNGNEFRLAKLETEFAKRVTALENNLKMVIQRLDAVSATVTMGKYNQN